MQARQVGCTDDTRVVHQLGDLELRLGVVAAGGEVLEIGQADRLEQQLAGLGDTAAEDEELRVEHGAEAGAGLAQPVAELPQAAPAPAPAPVAPPAPLPHANAGEVVALTDEMHANAALIVRIGRQEGVSDQGIVIALAAAAQESGLRNVQYGDRDSLGLFQQRPSTGWGTAAQVLDPERATRAFYGGAGNPNPGRTRGLLDIPGWTSMSVTQAAQAVQISAFPDAYAKWETSARAWLAQLG